jgi:hypothetical protein
LITLNYAELYQKYSSACRWIEASIGRPLRGRLSTVEELLSRLVQEDISGTLPDSKNDQLRAEAVLAFVEVMPVLDVYETFSGKSVVTIKNRLNYLIDGPTFTKDEGDKNNRGRNFLFELVFAAVMAKAGVPLDPDEDKEDGLFDIYGTRMFSACKRVQGKKGIERNIKDARYQLSLRLSGEEAQSVGFIAIDISKVVHGGINVFHAKSEAQGRDYIHKINEELISIGKKEILKLHPSILGVSAFTCACLDIDGRLSIANMWTHLINPNLDRYLDLMSKFQMNADLLNSM